MRSAFTFTSIVGQEPMKRALLLNAINPRVGGVVIRGERGTGKSTIVRALANLLPDVEVVEGCRFGCDPADPVRLCGECVSRIADGEELRPRLQHMQVVELPINASEDRVVGSIDMEAALIKGNTRFDPGLLARANRNILYADEVNLLDDHIVDVLLDAAAMGVNSVEREGISFVHPAQFILVGTMNPDEGELRPQLLDRFGLCVDVAGLRDVNARVDVMQRASVRMEPEVNNNDDRLRDLVATARSLQPLIGIDQRRRELIAAICVGAAVVGHRADIVIAHTAVALCALREAEVLTHSFTVSDDDIFDAAEFALAHRRRQPGGPRREEVHSEKGQPSAHISPDPPPSESDGEKASEPPSVADVGGERSPQDTDVPSGDESSGASADSGLGSSGSGDSRAGADYAGELFAVRKIALPRDRHARVAAGKRSQTESATRRGRYVRSVQREHTTDIALDATLRAAAPHQAARRVSSGATDGVHVEKQDLRQKVRRRKTGTLIVFAVDASASMDAEQRMVATKGAVLSLLRDAYIRRDKVALVVFSGRTARVVLAPTSSVDLARTRLQRLSVGGTTPLTHGLVAAMRVVRSERLRDSSILPLLVLISDGRGNISMFGEEPLLEAQRVAEQISAEGIRTLIIDSARDHSAGSVKTSLLGNTYAANACQDLATRTGGEYLGLFDLSQRAIVAGVERTLRSR